MNYEDFKDEFVEAVKDQLSEQGRDVRVEVRETNKLNESYAAITVTPEGSNVGVNADYCVWHSLRIYDHNMCTCLQKDFRCFLHATSLNFQ